MALFGKRSTEVDEHAKADQDRLARGGLPLGAERRLIELRKNGKFFTSNLSVNELALSVSEGVQPLGQVMGSTIYHIGWQYSPIYQSVELITLSQAHYHARLLALSRLQQEARLLGAHGIIGVRLERQAYEWGANLLEFAAYGTAVSLPDIPVPEHPFVCALSGQEFYALRRGGFFPVGFAFGTCTYYHVASYSTQWVNQGGIFGGGMQNIELTDYTQAVYLARHAAMSRLGEEAARVSAEGVVGVTIEDSIRTYEVEINDQKRRDLIVEFTALGTAIVSAGTDTLNIDYALPLE
jgi:uncharacterized protein YbjQ (UPF0145 family)